MNTKTEKRTSKSVILITCICLILVSGITVYVNMNCVRSIKQLVRRTTTENIAELTVSKAQFLDSKIRSEMLALQSFADSLGAGDDIFASPGLLMDFRERREASCVWMADMQGDYLDTGCRQNLPQVRKELFEGALQGNAGISEVFLGEMGKPQILFQTPIYKNGQVVGGLYEAYPVKLLQNTYGGSTYNDAGYSYVLGSDGTIVLAPVRFSYLQIYDNIQDVLVDGGNQEDSIASFMGALQSGARGSASFRFGGEIQLLSFTPLEEKEGWYFVTVIPLDMVEKDGTRIMSLSANMAAAIIAAVVLSLAIILASILYRQKKIRDYDRYVRDIYQAIAQNIDTAIFIVDGRTGQVEYAFENAERILGISPQAFSEPDSEAGSEFRKAFTDILKERPSEKLLMVIPLYNDLVAGRMWLKITALPVKLMGTLKYIFAATDVTQEQQTQANLSAAVIAAEKANASKSMFLSNMSHDIRTPMNAIVGMTQLAKAHLGDWHKVEDCLGKIEISSKHLLSLINDVLDMSKIESGKMTLTAEVFSLPELIQGDIAIVQPQCQSKGQRFSAETKNIIHEYLSGDSLRLNQVFLNLLSNASKFTPAGGTITFSIEELSQRHPCYAAYRFRVADSGIGISQEFLPKLFMPFERERSKGSGQAEGTGLGLVISKNIIEAMGGQLFVESCEGKGSVFTVEAELRLPEESSEEIRNAGFLEGIRALVADAVPEEGERLAMYLRDCGMSVDFVSDTEEALRCVRKNSYHLAVIEGSLPESGGAEAAKNIRSIAGDTVKIVLVTDSGFPENEFADSGCEGGIIMQKPIFKSILCQKLARLFEYRDTGSPKPVPEDVFSGKRFLLVEDNELNREIASQLLEMTGAVVECAPDGKAGAEAFEEHGTGYYDAIFMDIQMPVMNGYEATRRIRACGHPQADTIPIVAMSANTFSEDVRAALDSGMNAHVGKPIDMTDLADVLSGLL